MKQDAKQAKAYYAKACSVQNKVACKKGGVMILGRGGYDGSLVSVLYQLHQKCASKDLKACRRLAVLYSRGWGVKKDKKRTMDIFASACTWGHLESCVERASYAHDNPGKLDMTVKQARTSLDDLCSAKKYPEACHSLAVIESYKKNQNLVLSYLDRGCALKHQRSCNDWLGIALNKQHKHLHSSAVKRAEALCASKVGKGCFAMGYASMYGSGVAVSLQNAVLWYEKGGVRHSASCSTLGNLYSETNQPIADIQKAKAFYKKACAMYDVGSCFARGNLIYADKNSTPEEQKEAARLFSKTCSQNHSGGCALYARVIAIGQGTPKNHAKAVKLLNDRCAKKDGIACDELGQWYNIGYTLKKDPKQAKSYFQKACKHGYKSSCKLVK